MAKNRSWSAKRKMKARSTRLVAARMSRATAKQETSDSAFDLSSFAPNTLRSSSSPVLALQPSQPVPLSQKIFQHPNIESTESSINSEYESDARTFDDEAAQEVFNDFILCLPLEDRCKLGRLLGTVTGQ